MAKTKRTPDKGKVVEVDWVPSRGRRGDRTFKLKKQVAPVSLPSTPGSASGSPSKRQRLASPDPMGTDNMDYGSPPIFTRTPKTKV
jgi:hypothetical protein